ncbi:hypothetical protein [Sphingomonas sp. 1185]|uniref:hypothetical protein n=1 Tax=Sphingomonas sp. 1185 TaxID=3156411 RepID=UPI003393CCCC
MVVLQRLDRSTRYLLRQLLLELRADARHRAEKSWHTRKPPMAAYWAAVAVYAGHIARAIVSAPSSTFPPDDRSAASSIAQCDHRSGKGGMGETRSGRPSMPLDTLYRHQQALDPSALRIVTAGAHALAAAIEDCRAAGHDPENDPAVILLARHLGRIACAVSTDDATLKHHCAHEIARIRDDRHQGERTDNSLAPLPLAA